MAKVHTVQLAPKSVASMPELKPTVVQALPKLKRARKAKAPKECACGCGELTKGGRFVPGHDARLYAWMLRVERGVIKIEDIQHPGVRAAVEKAMAPKNT